MKKYRVYGIGTYSISEIVEASSPKEAEDKCKLHAPMICHACADEVEISDIYELQVQEELP